jgi:hypothetical protein
VDHVPPDPVLVLLPEVDARAALSGRTLSLRMLRPPYPAIGTGHLRLLRVAERDGTTELIVGYDGYERIESAPRVIPRPSKHARAPEAPQ